MVYSGYSAFLHQKTDCHDINEILLKMALHHNPNVRWWTRRMVDAIYWQKVCLVFGQVSLKNTLNHLWKYIFNYFFYLLSFSNLLLLFFAEKRIINLLFNKLTCYDFAQRQVVEALLFSLSLQTKHWPQFCCTYLGHNSTHPISTIVPSYTLHKLHLQIEILPNIFLLFLNIVFNL